MIKRIEKLKENSPWMLWVSILLILILICLITILILQNGESEKIRVNYEKQNQTLMLKNEEINRLNQEKEKLKSEIAKAAVSFDSKLQEKESLIKIQNEQLEASYMLPEYYLEFLKSHNVESPQILIDDLMNHKEIIPTKGVLGGNMYWVSNSTVVLNDKYVFSTYEDGHIMGYALLEYHFDEEHTIIWQVKNFFDE